MGGADIKSGPLCWIARSLQRPGVIAEPLLPSTAKHAHHIGPHDAYPGSGRKGSGRGALLFIRVRCGPSSVVKQRVSRFDCSDIADGVATVYLNGILVIIPPPQTFRCGSSVGGTSWDLRLRSCWSEMYKTLPSARATTMFWRSTNSACLIALNSPIH